MQAVSVDEVAGLLREKGFREDVVQLFVSNGIDGEAFLLLEDDKDLQTLGVPLMGDRLKLRKLIRDTRNASNEVTPAGGSSGTTTESVGATTSTTTTPAIPAPHVGERPIWIYVDNSNIWINAKQLAARRKKMKTKEDHRVRIDIGKLTSVVANGRPVAQGFLYASEPPPVDTVWEKIKECGWRVPQPKKRSVLTGKEKGVDAQLVADITEMACTTPEEQRTTIVIISGDADVVPAIQKVLKYKGWKVEVYMWENAMSSDLKKLPQAENRVKVHFLDESLEDITFTNMKFDPKHLQAQEKASAVVFAMEKNAFHARGRVPTKRWCELLESITQWPFQYYWVEWNEKETNDLVLVFKKGRGGGKEGESDPSADVFDTTRFLENLKEYQYSIPYTISAKPYLQYKQEKSGVWQMALEKVGRIGYVDAFEGDNGEISVSDEESDPWHIVQWAPPPRRSQLYTEFCPYKFNCTDGLKCSNKHTKDEEAFFRTNKGHGNPFRKTKLCFHYKQGKCKKEINKCLYAHGDDDAWCLKCRDKCGHFTDNCPKKS